jgi:DNA primase
MNEANNDPIKKADLIRDMVVSISKIPDRIKREIYIQECARIMDISEQVLLNTLAQMIQKDITEAGNKNKTEQKAFEVVKQDVQVVNEKLDILSSLEISIISMLVLYGNLETEFENIFINFDEEGNEIEVKEKVKSKVCERIYLSLQEDEICFTNPLFQEIYNDLIHNYISNSEFDIANYLNLMSEEKASIISDLIMENERYTLAGWLEKKQVFVKEKDSQEVMTNLVTETLISLREYLINKLIMDLMQSFQSESGSDIEELKNNINDYNKLKVNLTNKIGRIRSTYL